MTEKTTKNKHLNQEQHENHNLKFCFDTEKSNCSFRIYQQEPESFKVTPESNWRFRLCFWLP